MGVTINHILVIHLRGRGQGQLVCDMLYYTSLYDTDRWGRKMTLGLSMRAFVSADVNIQASKQASNQK